MSDSGTTRPGPRLGTVTGVVPLYTFLLTDSRSFPTQDRSPCFSLSLSLPFSRSISLFLCPSFFSRPLPLCICAQPRTQVCPAREHDPSSRDVRPAGPPGSGREPRVEDGTSTVCQPNTEPS